MIWFIHQIGKNLLENIRKIEMIRLRQFSRGESELDSSGEISGKTSENNELNLPKKTFIELKRIKEIKSKINIEFNLGKGDDE
jgi:hypothetical protein